MSDQDVVMSHLRHPAGQARVWADNLRNARAHGENWLRAMMLIRSPAIVGEAVHDLCERHEQLLACARAVLDGDPGAMERLIELTKES